MSKIKELPKSSSHLLQCTQIITSVQSVVKELVENAIDSLSKNIEIKLDNYGLDKIEVKDSGSGICKDDIDKVCKPHCTSKINSHADLNQIQTYGFRGEALAALCAVSDLTISTKTAEEQFGFTYTFGKNGEVVSVKPCACTQGTTIAASSLFKNIPVRKQYYRADKHKKEELKKIEDILIAFGCIHADIRFALFHDKSLIWQKPVVAKIREGLVSIFGSSIVDHMENCEFFEDKEQIKIEVFLPKGNAPAFCSSTSSNRSIISINKRPVRMKVIDKVLKQCFSQSLVNLSKSRYPICYISIEVPPSKTDVNVEPNKTSVVLHNMDIVTEQLTALLKTFYDNDSLDENIGKKATHTETTTKSKVINLDSPLKQSEMNIISRPAVNLPQALKFPNNKDNCLGKKKISNPTDSQQPTVKKMKTSYSGNDIYRHIKTMDSFFATKNSMDVRNTDINSTLQLKGKDFVSSDFQHQTNSAETSSNKNIQSQITPNLLSATSILLADLPNNQMEIHPSNIEQHFTTATAERKQLSMLTSNNEFTFQDNSSLIASNINMSNKPKETIDVSMNHKPDNNCHINDIDLIDLFDLDGANSKRLASNNVNTPTKDISNCKEIDEELNFQTAKLILEKNQNTLLGDDQEFCGKKSANNSCLSASKVTNYFGDQVSSNLSESQEWARGKHSIENLQPVAVLMPQRIQNCSKNVNSEKLSLKEKASPKELNNTVTNQRKMTAFDFFCRKHRLEIASLNPEITNHQIAQILTEKWSNLSADEKFIYKNMVDKPYPKNVKNKEKLNNIVHQNLTKIKGTPTKRKPKTKKKCKERVISFDLQTISNSNLSYSNENLVVIKCIAPGIWIYSQNNKLYILNTFRLQEMIIYQRLLKTFKFEPEKLEFPCIISNNTLTEEAVEVITQLPKEECYLAETIIDERIVANGFEINLLKSENDVQIQVVGMTKSIAFYSAMDLKEILLLLKEKGPSATLSECRPAKVILYLQSEAYRMAKQFPASKSIEDVEDLLKSKEILPLNCDSCIHSKPFIHEIATIS